MGIYLVINFLYLNSIGVILTYSWVLVMNQRIKLLKEAKDIWNKAASTSKFDRFNFDVERYKSILNLFHVGNYYYAIFNYHLKNFEFVSAEVETLFGYKPAIYNVPFLVSKIHPEDISHFMNFEFSAISFLMGLTPETLTKYKIRYDYRIQKNDGDYMRVLQQGIVLEHDKNGGILRTLIIHTDITGIKDEGKPILSFIGMDGKPSYINVDVKKVFTISNEVLTTREKEVLNLLIEGKPSKQISDILKISKQTVDKHRKNMLKKTQLKSTGELIGHAIRHGWL